MSFFISDDVTLRLSKILETLRSTNDKVIAIKSIDNELALIASLPEHYDPAWLCRIEDLELQLEVTKALGGQGIYFIGELVKKSWLELREIPGIKLRHRRQIEKVLDERGLHLNTKFTE